MVSLILIFLFVLGLTALTARWIARYQKGMAHNRNIRVIETFRVSNNKFIQIIQVGTKYLAISICKDTMHLLTELTEEQLLQIPSDGEDAPNGRKGQFQDILDGLRGKFPKK